MVDLAAETVRYLGGLTVTQGRRSGDPLKVLGWQRRFIAGAFAPGVQSAALSVGRGNGKTALLSGIAAATLDGPLAVPRGETIIVASSFSQARIAFDHVRAFMAEQLRDRRRWRVMDTAQQASIEDRDTGARLKVIVSDPKRAHGLAPVLVLADVPVAALIERGQGFKDGGEDVRDFRRACLEGRVVPAVSLLLRSAMGEARVVMDPAGNAKLAKNAEGGRRVRARDDAAAAAILAVATGARRGAHRPRRRRHALAG